MGIGITYNISVIKSAIGNSKMLLCLAVLAFNILFFGVMAAVLPMQYEENDDIMMAMIANGTYSGTPDYHLVYINVIYGFVLAWLYGLNGAVEWYTWSFVVLHVVSMTMLVYCILTTPNRARWERVAWIGLLYVLWARIIIALQFTTTAGLTCLAGCVMLMRERRTERWVGAGWIVIAALVRFMAAGLVGVLMAPIIVYTLRTDWRRYIPIVVMLCAVVGCRMANHAVYDRNPEWRYYREYNQLRAQLNDNPNAYTLRPEQLPEGIDWIDYQLLLRFIPDAEQIDLAAIRQLSATVGKVPVKRQLQNLHRMDKYAVEIAILAALLVMMILTTGNRSKYIFLIAYSLFIAGLTVHVSMDGFLKNRVFLCMLAPLLVTDYMLLPNTTGMKRRWGIMIAMAVMGGWYVYQTANEAVSVRHNEYQWQRLQQPVMSYVPAGAYVTTIGTSMTMEANRPMRIWPLPYRKYTLGWMTWCPLNKPVGHSYRTLLREDMYILTNTGYMRERTAIPRICEQIEKHYGVKTRIRPICHNSAYALIQLVIEERR